MTTVAILLTDACMKPVLTISPVYADPKPPVVILFLSLCNKPTYPMKSCFSNINYSEKVIEYKGGILYLPKRRISHEKLLNTMSLRRQCESSKPLCWDQGFRNNFKRFNLPLFDAYYMSVGSGWLYKEIVSRIPKSTVGQDKQSHRRNNIDTVATVRQTSNCALTRTSPGTLYGLERASRVTNARFHERNESVQITTKVLKACAHGLHTRMVLAAIEQF